MKLKGIILIGVLSCIALALMASLPSRAAEKPVTDAINKHKETLISSNTIIIRLKPAFSLQEKTGSDTKVKAFSETPEKQKEVSALEKQLEQFGVKQIKKTIPLARKPSEIKKEKIKTLSNEIPDLTTFYTITINPRKFGINPQPISDKGSTKWLSIEKNPEEFKKYELMLRIFKSNPAIEEAEPDYIYSIDEDRASQPNSGGGATPTLAPCPTTTPQITQVPITTSAPPAPTSSAPPSAMPTIPQISIIPYDAGGPTPTPALFPCSTPTPSVSPTPLPFPNDPYFWASNSWGQEYDDQWDMKKIKADRAWNEGTPSAYPIVAVVDTGVDYNHEDLHDVMWNDENGKHGYDFVNGDDDPMDDRYHGTHVAGTIGASIHNGKGIAGTADRVKIMAVKVLGNQGYGSSEDVGEGIAWAVDHGARVINMSLGGGNSAIIRIALQYANAMGVVSIASAGNDDEDARGQSPANLPTVITVSASAPDDARAEFSNWGPKIDIAAPGGGTTDDCNRGLCSNILSTEASQSAIPQSRKVTTRGPGYARLDGTSMAAPHVAGAAAMILSRNNTLTPQQVKNVLTNSADDVSLEGKDYDTGYGRLNVYKAITEMNTQTPQNPFVDIQRPLSGRIIRRSVSIWGTITQTQGTPVWSISYSSSREGPWNTNGITLRQNGAGNANGELGTWDISALADGTYYIRIQAGGEKKTTVLTRVYVNPSLPTAWPARILGQGYGLGSIVVGDVDNDRRDDMAIYSGNELHFLNANGREIDGWPKQVRDFEDYGTTYPAIGNVTNQNPGNEIVFTSRGSQKNDPDILSEGLYVTNPNGSALSGWPKLYAGNYRMLFSSNPPVLADLDGDNVNEIIYISYLERSSYDLLAVFKGDGQLMSGFPIRLPGYAVQQAYVVRSNGNIRILVVAYDYSVNGYRILQYNTQGVLVTNGSTIQYWPENPVLADLNGDSNSELVWSRIDYPDTNSSQTYKINLYAYSIQGNPLSGWPKIIDTGILRTRDCEENSGISFCGTTSDYYTYRLLTVDVDSDQKPDLVQFGTRYQYNQNTSYSEWTRVALFGVSATGLTLSLSTPDGARIPGSSAHPTILDTNSDGKQEIVYLASDYRTYRNYLESIQVDNNQPQLVLDADIAPMCSSGSAYSETLTAPLANLHTSGRASILALVCADSPAEDVYALQIMPVRLGGSLASLHAWPQYLHDSLHSNQYSLVSENRTTITDSFTRFNNTTSLGSTETGQPWIITKGRFGITNNQAYTSTRCPAPGYALLDSGSNDGVLEVTLAANYQDARIPFRYIDENNYYWVERRGRDYMLAKRFQGSQRGLGSIVQTPTNGDRIKIEFRDTTINVYINGILKLTRSDNALTSATKHGIGVWCDTRNRFDNFSISP